MKKHSTFSIIFALIFVAHLIGIAMDYSMLVLITKPMIAASLLLYFYSVSHLANGFQKRIFTGLVFSLIGDVLLMMVDRNPNFFIAGLVAFLIAQVCYITAFYLDFKGYIAHNKVILFGAIIVFGSFCFSLYSYLSAGLGDMQIPVLCYAIIISIMAISATNRYGRVNKISFLMIFLGAVFFLVSDTALAIRKFSNEYNYAGIIIMSTYMLAQYYITVGSLNREMKN